MNENNILSIGNITTIINTIALTLAGYLFGFLASLFGNLPFDVVQLSSVISSILFLIFAIVNARYHNDFFDIENDNINIPLPLKENEIRAIQNYIRIQTGETIKINDIEPKDKIMINNRAYDVLNDAQQDEADEEI